MKIRLSYSQEQKLKCMFLMYFSAMINMVGVFTIISLFIILKNITKWLMGY